MNDSIKNEDRLHLIHDAASHLFINKGYARTQIQDIAHRIGLSTGMLYVYFSGKRSIFDFLLKGVVDPGFFGRVDVLPIPPSSFASLEKDIEMLFARNMQTFASHADGLEDYPLKQMFGDAFDTVASYGKACLLIEKNPEVQPSLFDSYRAYRTAFFSRILEYMTGYMQRGTCRTLVYPEYSVQLIVETIAWWAMHVSNDAFEVQDLPLETAKAVCLDNLVHAYEG